MNISELARRLRTHPDDLREKLPMLGFDVGKRAIKVDDRLVPKIQEKWGEMQKMNQLRAKYKREEEIKQVAASTGKTIELAKVISVRDFAAALGLPVNIVIGELMKNGILASLNERIDFETASIVAEDLGFKVAAKADNHEAEEQAGMSAEKLKEVIGGEDAEKLQPRPPVVVVMGHVDHGKTQLLDTIRKTNVVKGEAGGITQHIGAYQVEKKGRRITFIDTPGHEAFTVMRSRGARVADVAILVVAADEGVQPQTVEVIKIIEAAKLPFVVALNKIDKPNIDLQFIKKQLADHNLIAEDWGGKTIMAPVSGKTGQGIDDLLDTILLVADIDKDKIRANPERRAIGTVIEAHVDKGEGPVCTMLVQTGTLRVNDVLSSAGAIYGRVRAMRDWNGDSLKEAPPGTPVKILGFKVAPQVGEIVEVPENAAEMKQVKKQYTVEKKAVRAAVSQEEEKSDKKKFVNIVLKTDVLGSLEAVTGSLEKMVHPEVGAAVIGKGLGNINETDVLRAEAAGGVVMGFNVVATREAQILARDKKVEIFTYKVIYHLFDEVKKRLQALLPVEVITTPLGKLEVLAIFRADKTGQVVGGRVTDGHVPLGAKMALYRGGEAVGEGDIIQLQTGKSDTKDVRSGQECGIKVKCKTAILVGDVMDVYSEERKEKKLDLPV